MDSGAQAKLVRLTKECRALQDGMETHLKSQAALGAQETENAVVLEELENLEESAVVYKLVGPALVKQDTKASVDNVKKRLEYIRDEKARVEKLFEESKTKIDNLAQEIHTLQTLLQNSIPAGPPSKMAN